MAKGVKDYNHYGKPYRDWTDYEVTFPKFYQTSDKPFLFGLLDRLGFHERRFASDKYSFGFLEHGRGRANEWLVKFVDKHGMKVEDVAITGHSESHHERIMQMSAKPKRNTILGMADKRR